MTTRNDYAKFKRIYDHGTLIGKANKNTGFNIKLYAVKNLHSELKRIPDKGKESEVKKCLQTLNEEKNSFQCEEFPNNEEYISFLENMFANVDDEDRCGEVTLKTAQSFRIVADLIEVLKNWGDIPEEWAKKMKYCKFKSVDISKCINSGTTPKRGNPNEKNEEDELDKELKMMNNEELQKEQKQEFNMTHEEFPKDETRESVEFPNKNHFNINYIDPNVNERISNLDSLKNNKPFDYIKPSDMSIEENANVPSEQQTFKDINDFDINNFDINKVSKSQTDHQEKPSNLNLDFDALKDFKNLSPRGNAASLLSNNVNDKYENINQKPIRGPLQEPKITVLPGARKSEVSEKDIKKIEEIVEKKIKPIDTSKFHKKLDFALPVKYKTPDYYKLSTIINKLMSNSKKDMEANNPDKAKENLDLANYYLTKIIK